jgi:hypothetical protein
VIAGQGVQNGIAENYGRKTESSAGESPFDAKEYGGIVGLYAQSLSED